MIHRISKATSLALCAQLLWISQENKSLEEKAEPAFTDKYMGWCFPFPQV